MLEIINLSKRYNEKQVIKEISFSVNKGEIVGLIGKNGAGKSTILKSIAGLLQYNEGEILYNGINCKQDLSVIQDFGILIDCGFLDYVSAYDNLKLLYRLDSRHTTQDVVNVIDEVFELVGLDHVKHKRVKTYSFGMKQRLGLAQAIINAQSFIMLDEPFIGLDPIGKDIVKKAIVKKAKEENYGILFSSHDLEDVAEICDRIVMIDKGKCVYNDVIISELEYRIYLEEGFNVETFKRLEKKLAQFKIWEDGFSFVDNADYPQISDILRTVLQETKILKIESTSNMLKNMFVGEENDETDL